MIIIKLIKTHLIRSNFIHRIIIYTDTNNGSWDKRII